MIYVLKIIWDYRVPLLELIVRNIARYPQSATLMSIRYQPAIRYLLACGDRTGYLLERGSSTPPCHDSTSTRDNQHPSSPHNIPATGKLSWGMPRSHPSSKTCPQRLIVGSCPVDSTLTTHPKRMPRSPQFFYQVYQVLDTTCLIYIRLSLTDITSQI
jgi:hypothetical protein